MMRKFSLLLPVVLGAIVSPSGAFAQGAATSALLTNIRYEVTFTRANGVHRRVTSTMTFTVGGTDAVLLSLPKWTPGAYEIDNFAREVSNFSAEQSGNSLAWDKIDPDTWRIRPRGVGEVTVRFDYLADSLDNANTWSRPDFLLFNGTNLFLYPEGRGFDFPSSVTVNTEAGWKIVTGMSPAGAHRYAASNYHDLVDMPFFVGQFDLDSAQISGTWVRFATYPSGSVTGPARVAVWEALKLVIPAEIKVFGEVPWTTYSVMQITDYYADLAEIRGGIVNANGFYAMTSDKMSEVSSLPPTALEDASLSTWIH